MGVLGTNTAPSLQARLRGFRRHRDGGLPASLYRENLPAVIRTLRRLGVREAELADVAQEVFLIALRRRDDLHALQSPRAWLFCVARRVASNHRRKHANRLTREASWALAMSPSGGDQPELELDLEAFLETLTQRDREAFVLGHLEGMTRVELADALGVAEGTAYSRLRRARKQLEEFFADAAASEEAVEAEREQQSRAYLALLPLLPPELLDGAPLASGAVGASAAGGSSLASLVTGFAVTFAVAFPVLWFGTRPQSPAPQAVASAPAQTPARRTPTASTLPTPVAQAQDVPEAPPAATPVVEAAAVQSTLDAPVTSKSKPSKRRVRTESEAGDALPSQVDPKARASALELEVELLAQARSALARGERSEADAALSSLRRERPRPALAEEAAALYTEFACRYESSTTGQQAFAGFTARFSGSAYARSLESLCASAKDE